MKNLLYAEKRINLLKDEMGKISSVFMEEGGLYLEFENGMNVQLHDGEIIYQAISYLESEIESIKN